MKQKYVIKDKQKIDLQAIDDAVKPSIPRQALRILINLMSGAAGGVGAGGMVLTLITAILGIYAITVAAVVSVIAAVLGGALFGGIALGLVLYRNHKEHKKIAKEKEELYKDVEHLRNTFLESFENYELMEQEIASLQEEIEAQKLKLTSSSLDESEKKEIKKKIEKTQATLDKFVEVQKTNILHIKASLHIFTGANHSDKLNNLFGNSKGKLGDNVAAAVEKYVTSKYLLPENPTQDEISTRAKNIADHKKKLMQSYKMVWAQVDVRAKVYSLALKYHSYHSNVDKAKERSEILAQIITALESVPGETYNGKLDHLFGDDSPGQLSVKVDKFVEHHYQAQHQQTYLPIMDLKESLLARDKEPLAHAEPRPNPELEKFEDALVKRLKLDAPKEDKLHHGVKKTNAALLLFGGFSTGFFAFLGIGALIVGGTAALFAFGWPVIVPLVLTGVIAGVGAYLYQRHVEKKQRKIQAKLALAKSEVTGISAYINQEVNENVKEQIAELRKEQAIEEDVNTQVAEKMKNEMNKLKDQGNSMAVMADIGKCLYEKCSDLKVIASDLRSIAAEWPKFHTLDSTLKNVKKDLKKLRAMRDVLNDYKSRIDALALEASPDHKEKVDKYKSMIASAISINKKELLHAKDLVSDIKLKMLDEAEQKLTKERKVIQNTHDMVENKELHGQPT